MAAILRVGYIQDLLLSIRNLPGGLGRFFVSFLSEEQFQLAVEVAHDFSILNDSELLIFGQSLFFGLLVCDVPTIWK